MYPVVFFDALRVKIREEELVRNKPIDLALGILPDGTRDIRGCGSRIRRARSSG
jgi:transposase-like protein